MGIVGRNLRNWAEHVVRQQPGPFNLIRIDSRSEWYFYKKPRLGTTGRWEDSIGAILKRANVETRVQEACQA